MKNQEKFRDLIEGCSSNSSKHDILYRLRIQLITKIADQLKFEKVFIADNSTTIAIKVLSNIAIGRGSQIPSDVVSFFK